MINFFSSEPMKYWSMSSTISPFERQMKLEELAASGQYYYGEKTDGNWTRAVITPSRTALQTRGISKKTGVYGEVQDKVLFWDKVVNAFTNDTVILGEVFMDGCVDRQIGSILRCLPDKALARQKVNKLHWRIFDVLCYEGENLMDAPFEVRITYIPKVVSQINSELVEGVTYKLMTENFFEEIEEIFMRGGEGAVCYKKDSIYIPGKRGPHAWDTVKVKQEISKDIDCFITGVEPATRLYNGKDIGTWMYWENIRTKEKIYGENFMAYQTGQSVEPVTKNYFFGWPGAIYTSVYDSSGNIIPLCKVAGLTEEMKEDLKANFEENWHYCPVTIGGMAISDAHSQENGIGISIRHPYLKSIRRDDIDIKDCTLTKILM